MKLEVLVKNIYRVSMAGVKQLVVLALIGSIGLLLLFLACALPQFNSWLLPFTAPEETWEQLSWFK